MRSHGAGLFLDFALVRRLSSLLVALAAVLTVALVPLRTPVGAAGTPARHVFVIVMENRDYQSALSDPGIAALAARYGSATQYYAAAHPSLPNYLALAGGGTFGVTSDCVTCFVARANLESELVGHHVSFAAYLEGAPGNCFLASYGGTDYAAKHNPWRYFTNVRSSKSLCSFLHPLTSLARTLRGPASAVAQFTWITPNMCHDGHDCSTATASAWLTREVSLITASPAWRANGALFVTWDEGTGDQGVRAGQVVAGAGGGQVLTIVAGPHTPPGAQLSTPLSHYSLLGTVEDLLHVPRLAQAKGAGSLASLLSAG